MSTNKSGWRKNTLGIFAVLVATGAVIGYTQGVWGLHGSRGGVDSNRPQLYAAAIAQVENQALVWPKSEAELIHKFWNCIATGDLQQAVLYCPGSKSGDFSAYGHMKPTEQIQLGTPAPHPTIPGVMLWPVKASFAHFGAKTIKLAVTRLPAGRLVIDGQHSIWW